MNTALQVVAVGRYSPARVKFTVGVDCGDFSDYNAGCLLRMHRRPIEDCANGSQRRGWWAEHARLTQRIKPRRYNLTATPDDLPY